MIKEITNKKKCVGCSSCATICPKNAIRMVPDSKGFLYPQIDDNCIECNSCIRACPANSPTQNISPIEVKAMQNKDEAVLKNSSSGGFFYSIARFVLSNNGLVYGVVYNEKFDAIHTRISSIDGLYEAQGSKYVQSDINHTYELIKEDLRNKHKVLFTGTSCQCDGLMHYLSINNINDDNLYTIALLCHGVPTSKLFHDHIESIERIRNKKVVKYLHREKVHGWHEHNECIHFDDGSVEWRTKLSQNFKDLFYLNVILRESCYQCPYAESPCASDIVIGDYWGMEYYFPQGDNNKGTSIVLVISEKGKWILDSVATDFVYYPVDKSNYLKYNHHSPCRRPEFTDDFWNEYFKYGYDFVIKKYADYNLFGSMKWRAKKELRRLLVKIRVIKA